MFRIEGLVARLGLQPTFVAAFTLRDVNLLRARSRGTIVSSSWSQYVAVPNFVNMALASLRGLQWPFPPDLHVSHYLGIRFMRKRVDLDPPRAHLLFTLEPQREHLMLEVRTEITTYILELLSEGHNKSMKLLFVILCLFVEVLLELYKRPILRHDGFSAHIEPDLIMDMRYLLSSA